MACACPVARLTAARGTSTARDTQVTCCRMETHCLAQLNAISERQHGARSRNRTDIPLRVRDFKSLASTSFAIRAARAWCRNAATNRNPGQSRDCRDLTNWRPRSELNRRTRICSPLHNHSATRPDDACDVWILPHRHPDRDPDHTPKKTKPRERGLHERFRSKIMEREKGLEPSTPTLARSCSTN